MASIGLAAGVRLLVNGSLPPGYPFLLSFAAVMLSALLFKAGPGMLTIGLAVAAVDWVTPEPAETGWYGTPGAVVASVIFATVATLLVLVIETLHRTSDGLRAAEHRMALHLREFRHRTRNDLANLVALLLLRARASPQPEVREALREAAEHAMALARVHTRLTTSVWAGTEGAMVDSREFLLGLLQDLEALISAEGLRPVSLTWEVESHPLDSERAVQLGLVVNEAVTNAIKYAFPGERGGHIRVVFRRHDDRFQLTVDDDGIGISDHSNRDCGGAGRAGLRGGLGSRLLRAQAAQLRGQISRGRRQPPGQGTALALDFPVDPPSRLPVPA